MHNELALMAAQEWARAHAAANDNPLEFGRKVAQVHRACTSAWLNAGDEKATAAALAALSVRPEILQAIAQLSSLFPHRSAATSSGQTGSVGAGA